MCVPGGKEGAEGPRIGVDIVSVRVEWGVVRLSEDRRGVRRLKESGTSDKDKRERGG